MLGIPNLNIVYEDELLTLIIQDLEGKGELLVLHAEVIPTTNREILGHYLEVMDNLFQQLKEKGVKEIETWVYTDEEIKYAQFFGFDELLGELTNDGERYYPPLYRLRKRLI